MIALQNMRNLWLKLSTVLRSYGVLIGLVIIILIASILEPSFFTAGNLLNILRQASVIGIVCLGVTYVMITGGLDLSVGAIVSLCSVVAVSLMNRYGQQPGSNGVVILAIFSAAFVGFGVGIANGSIIAALNGRLGETFIITYGMQIVVASLALLYSGGQFITGTFGMSIYQRMGTGLAPVFIFISLAVVMHVILAYTWFGKHVCFIGANIECALMSGLRVRRLRVLTYGISGMTAGLAAIIVTSRVYSASPLQGTLYELEAIAAIVVGGTSQSGGTGGIINTVLGVLVLSVLGNALNVIGVDANAQLLVRGAIIVIAVGLDMWNQTTIDRSPGA